MPMNTPATPNIDLRELTIYEAIPDRGTVPVKLLLTIKEASEILAISRSKLYGLLNSGGLPSVHIGRSRRLRLTDLEKFVMDSGQEF